MVMLSTSFIQIQLVIFVSIVISSLLGGKKIALMAVIVWAIETAIIYRSNRFNFIQVITVVFAFQIGMILAIARDAIIKRINKKKKQELGSS